MALREVKNKENLLFMPYNYYIIKNYCKKESWPLKTKETKGVAVKLLKINLKIKDEGDEVTVSVLSVDRGPLDFSNIRGVVLDKKNDLYKIGTETV